MRTFDLEQFVETYGFQYETFETLQSKNIVGRWNSQYHIKPKFLWGST